uniref:Uncharacterized protein n=1 Tax=viral metagenome TaxID=1070528 RepID=A0A6M3J6K8_9ZZZZ
MSDIRMTIGATTKDFNLAVENRQKLFNIREEPIVPIKSLSDIPSYGDLPPEKILAFVQNNWRGGMGQKDRFITPDMFADGQSIDTREPNQIILGPLINTIGAVAATVSYQLFFEDREYAASTRYVWKLSADNTTWTQVLDVGAGDTIECMGHYDGYIYVGLTTGLYYYSNTGESGAWTQYTTDANGIMHEVCVAPSFSSTKDILVLAQRPNIVRTTISPLNAGAGWLDPPYYIGDEYSNITSLFVLNGTLFIGKEDGLYALPVDGRPIKVLDYSAQKSSTNFAYHTNWQGITYINAADDILEIIGGSGSVYSIDYVGPLHKSPELATIGSVKGIASDDKNIYAVYLVGSNYIIYAGRERRDERYGLRWEWTPHIYLSTNACGSIQVAQRTSASPKLWFAYGTNMANAILAKAPNLPLGDSAYRFCAQGYLITSYFDAGYDTWQKLFYQLWTVAENLSASHITITVTYQKDTDSSWSALATVTSNGVQSVDLSALAGKKFRLKFQLDSDDSTITPILREFIYRGILQPEITRTLDFTIVLEQSTSRKVSSDLSFLEDGRTATSPITLKDLRFGTTKYVTFLPNSPMEVEVMDEVTKQPSYRARILAQQLNWTAP